MIAITPQMRILVAVQPVDFRKGIDGLVAYVVKSWRGTRSEARCSFSVRVVATPSSV